ncbi:MAG: NTP transferase domain-containing protein [Clostridia bacterium]|nr:NTP transferase domain-containing protein [Clostridia bacterium]
MSVDYIIVQAGGKGSRMESLTRNKPKALVPINNLPMIFHLFRKFPSKKFIVIGDYKYDVLQKYLQAFAEVNYTLVRGESPGTCSGLQDAMSHIPDGKPFLLIWCDLVLDEDYNLPEQVVRNIIGISKDFECRWKYENNSFEESKSAEQGVAGFFIFKDKAEICDVPKQGEFVRWLQNQGMIFDEQPLYNTHEYGLYNVWIKISKMKCRPFNKITVQGDKLIKEGIDAQGKALAVREVAWYKKVQNLHLDNIPNIFSFDPICMNLVCGKNIYEYGEKTYDEKCRILEEIVGCLKSLHATESVPSDKQSYRIAYIDKTFDRLKKVKNLVPFANDEYVVVNGKKCRNIFYIREDVENRIMSYFPQSFKLIHGDCTFSNIMLHEDVKPILLDPRGYFGTTELYGDVAYDWAKLYYSLFSNYDQFNLKRFILKINEEDVFIKIESNNWEELENKFFELLETEVSKKQIKLILAIIWLSLTTYAWEDYDSICGAFYNGLLYLEDALNEHDV